MSHAHKHPPMHPDFSPNIRPLADRIVVRRKEAVERSKGGIIIPDNAKEKPVEGTIVAVGPGRVLEDGTYLKPDVQVGDKILFGKYAGHEVKIHDEDFTIMREDDVLAVLA